MDKRKYPNITCTPLRNKILESWSVDWSLFTEGVNSCMSTVAELCFGRFTLPFCLPSVGITWACLASVWLLRFELKLSQLNGRHLIYWSVSPVLQPLDFLMLHKWGVDTTPYLSNWNCGRTMWYSYHCLVKHWRPGRAVFSLIRLGLTNILIKEPEATSQIKGWYLHQIPCHLRQTNPCVICPTMW